MLNPLKESQSKLPHEPGRPVQIAAAIDAHAEVQDWLAVALQFDAVSDTDELCAVRRALIGIGRPFETLFHHDEHEVIAALRRIIQRSPAHRRERYLPFVMVLEMASALRDHSDAAPAGVAC